MYGTKSRDQVRNSEIDHIKNEENLNLSKKNTKKVIFAFTCHSWFWFVVECKTDFCENWMGKNGFSVKIIWLQMKISNESPSLFWLIYAIEKLL